MKQGNEVAIFGGGCFWCTEAVFNRLKGVSKVTSGYAGGTVANPSYFDVSEEKTGHAEVVKIEFDPSVITYENLLEVFWAVHDPTTLNRQGADIGSQYRSIIFYTSEDQKKAAEKSIHEMNEARAYPEAIVTTLEPLDTFYEAEEYHQKYFDRNQDAPYCQVVIAPKIETLVTKFNALVK